MATPTDKHERIEWEVRGIRGDSRDLSDFHVVYLWLDDRREFCEAVKTPLLCTTRSPMPTSSCGDGSQGAGRSRPSNRSTRSGSLDAPVRWSSPRFATSAAREPWRRAHGMRVSNNLDL